jgi:hypothetical protein
MQGTFGATHSSVSRCTNLKRGPNWVIVHKHQFYPLHDERPGSAWCWVHFSHMLLQPAGGCRSESNGKTKASTIKVGKHLLLEEKGCSVLTRHTKAPPTSSAALEQSVHKFKFPGCHIDVPLKGQLKYWDAEQTACKATSRMQPRSSSLSRTELARPDN